MVSCRPAWAIWGMAGGDGRLVTECECGCACGGWGCLWACQCDGREGEVLLAIVWKGSSWICTRPLASRRWCGPPVPALRPCSDFHRLDLNQSNPLANSRGRRRDKGKGLVVGVIECFIGRSALGRSSRYSGDDPSWSISCPLGRDGCMAGWPGVRCLSRGAASSTRCDAIWGAAATASSSVTTSGAVSGGSKIVYTANTSAGNVKLPAPTVKTVASS
mmetsp:Transcript_36550/g.91507  ORF Transcript_36550/g.91507 Transcript_36550/m.91507 type:complete len:218 (+) Transcript_36550:1116-1769(+)